MTSRRHVIKVLGLSVLPIQALGGSFDSTTLPSKEDPDYWKNVREQFHCTHIFNSEEEIDTALKIVAGL